MKSPTNSKSAATNSNFGGNSLNASILSSGVGAAQQAGAAEQVGAAPRAGTAKRVGTVQQTGAAKQAGAAQRAGAFDGFPAGRPIWERAVNLRRDPEMKEVWRRAGMPMNVAAEGGLLEVASLTPFADGRRLRLLQDASHRLYYSISNSPNSVAATHEASDANGASVNDSPNSDAISASVNDSPNSDAISASVNDSPYSGVNSDGDNGGGGSGAPSSGAPQLMGELGAEVIHLIADSEGVIRLMLRHRPDRYVCYDSSLTPQLVPELDDLPEIHLVATGFDTLYQPVEAVALSGTSPGSSGSQLTAGDALRLASNMIASYDALRARAADYYLCCQPRAMRYRILDPQGGTLAVGPTVILGPTGGVAAGGVIVRQSGDNLATLGASTMQMQVWKPGLVIPQQLTGAAGHLAATLVVEATDEIEPLIRGVGAPHGIQRNSSTGVVTVSAMLPGFGNGSSLDTVRLATLGRDALSAPMHEIGRFTLPFAGGLGDHAEGATIALESISGNLADTSREAPSILPQREVSYSAAMRDGDLTILCNPRYKGLTGWAPLLFVATRQNAPAGSTWKLAITAEISTPAGVEKVTAISTGTSPAPASLSPVLSFPDAAATALTVTYLSPDGTLTADRYPLRPMAGSGIAAYVAPGLAPRSFTTPSSGIFPATASTPAVRVLPGVACLAHSSDPGILTDTLRICSGEIHAVASSPRSGSGWDFSRRKLLIAGESGTFIATVNGAGAFHACAPVDFRAVKCRGAVAPCSRQQGATMAMIAGDDIIAISGQRVATLYEGVARRLGSPATMLVYNDTYRELVVASESGALLRITANGEAIGCRIPNFTDTGAALRLRACSDGVYAATPTATRLLSREDTSTLMDLRLHLRLAPPDTPIRGILTELYASNILGTFSICGDRGTEVVEPLLKLTLTGGLNAPMPVITPGISRRCIELVYELAATADLAISPARLITAGCNPLNPLSISRPWNSVK